MKIIKYIKRILIDLLIVFLAFFTVATNSTFHGELVVAEGLSAGEESINYPYSRTFTISAYYSPLPCQNRYATGSYSGDIRLNGSGVNSADGTPVYPGMIAAPKSYPFGTKMDIPGVGIVAVHDRGGAIKATNGIPGVYDRLDVWMGYGDKGLERALNWGKRTFDVVVYGQNDSISEQIALDGFSDDERTPRDCVVDTFSNETISGEQISSTPEVESTPALSSTPEVESPSVIQVTRLDADLKIGSSGPKVTELQNELKRLNFFKTDLTGYYGPVTEHAVFKFQQSQRLVGDLESQGAGIFGPKTRDRMNEIFVARSYTTIQVAQTTAENFEGLLAYEIGYGATGPEVTSLQKFLKARGFFEGSFVTDYYGSVTREAVRKFQLEYNLIDSSSDSGAGHVGPSTLKMINSFS
ncbi:MAG: peptidoglycan-binding protein [bacterium]|nr:peptidoglycan-binding protein [bacterium]